MPCRDGGPSYEEVERERRRLDVMARLACEYCRHLESNGQAVPAWAEEWWSDHKRKDAERERRERAEAERTATRKRAMSKLTAEELDALKY